MSLEEAEFSVLQDKLLVFICVYVCERYCWLIPLNSTSTSFSFFSFFGVGKGGGGGQEKGDNQLLYLSTLMNFIGLA